MAVTMKTSLLGCEAIQCGSVIVEPPSEWETKAVYSTNTMVSIIYKNASHQIPKDYFSLICYNFTCITIIVQHSFVPLH